MTSQLSTRYANARYILVGTLVLLLAASFPLVAAAGASEVSYSGDDAYDPAAGGLFESESSSESSSAYEAGLAFSGGYSGDDAYDPAAGGLSASFSSVTASPNAIAAFEESGPSYSGDDAYDPAASDLSAAFLLAESDDCEDSSGFALVGNYSGDDAYDPAAGGIPNSSLIGAVCV